MFSKKKNLTAKKELPTLNNKNPYLNNPETNKEPVKIIVEEKKNEELDNIKNIQEEDISKYNSNIIKEINQQKDINIKKIPNTITNFYKRGFSAVTRENFFNMPSISTNQKRPVSCMKHTVFGISPIPNTLLGRLKLLSKIFKDPTFINYYNKAPSKITHSFEQIRKYLFDYSNHHNELDKYAMFFYYLCHQITYDIKGVNKDNKDIQALFKSGLANNFQFAKIFDYICRKSKIKVKRIAGFCKDMVRPYFKPGSDISIYNHCWNAVFIQNNWYFVDLTFGSGGIKKKSDFVHEYFNPFYFLTPAEFLAYTHKPFEEIWEFTNKQIQDKSFAMRKNLYLGNFYQKVYEHDVELYSHDFPIIHSLKLLST